MLSRSFFSLLSLMLVQSRANAQTLHEYPDSVVLSGEQVTVIINTVTGRLNYRFTNGITLDNTIAYVEDIHSGRLSSADLRQHSCSTERVRDSLGKGIRINIKHMDDRQPLYLLQHITLYADQPYLLIDVEAGRTTGQGPMPETRNISPLAILSGESSRLFIPGGEPRILDFPFDNDDWVGLVERKCGDDPSSKAPKGPVSGTSYECAAVYDNVTLSGLVIGSLSHDFWKTGITYRAVADKGHIDSFTVYGGAATPDNPSLPHAYGGQDGTHDHAPHGTMTGNTVHSPLIYLCGMKDVRPAFTGYGEMNARLNGRLSWKGYAPVYWNSFGVEGVLGYEKVMMPPGVGRISDFIHTLDNFNRYSAPVLSIDSYDQSIYTTELLASLSKYGKKQHQQMGFYFIPFAVWTWKNAMDRTPVAGTPYSLKEVILKDKDGNPIAYKDGDWGAFPLDPTHPATRLSIISQLQKAKAIHATFLKIDFLSAGALESSVRFDPSVRSGMQAYNQGMKMLKHLIDSILGPDIFITQAISPMFPHQYAHTRFISTDVYSHLRDDQAGFPNWGSTESSLATGSFLWWVQGTLWPYTNLDVSIMKSFEKNPDLSEQEIKIRIYAMMVMGSILGDGSDYRQPLAAQRAKKFLDNPAICAFFSHPKAFTPLQFADGDSFDQQMVFYLKPDPPATAGRDAPLLALFNFDKQQSFKKSISLETLGLPKGKYILKDFITDAVLGTVENGQDSISLAIPEKDAWLMKIIKE
jgi:alpha-galactosidase